MWVLDLFSKVVYVPMLNLLRTNCKPAVPNALKDIRENAGTGAGRDNRGGWRAGY